MLYKKFADDWIETADLWCWKQPIYQLSHNHCPRLLFTWGPEFKTSSLAILIEHLFFDYCAEKTKIKTNMNNRLQYVNRLLNFRGTILWNSIFTFFYAILWNNTSAHIRPSAAPTTLEQPPQLRCSARF